MSRPRLLLAVGALFLVWWFLPWPGKSAAQPEQPSPLGTPSMPLTQVVLYDNGLGYFQREGEVIGNAQIELKVPARNVNDLLKSLLTEDTRGGHIAAVRLDPPHSYGRPSELAALLNLEPTLDQMLYAARGEKVEIHLHPSKTNPQPSPLSGTLLGVSNPILTNVAPPPEMGSSKPEEVSSLGNKLPVQSDCMVSLLSQQGLTSLPLSQIKSVRLLDPHLEAEMRRAAEMLAARNGSELHVIRLNFTGTGRRTVRVGYVTEHPLWRTSYRLLLAKEGKTTLQGWALLENVTDEDWNNVSLTLMAGQPNSFQTDLATPLYVERPIREPKRHEALRSRFYLPSYPYSLSLQLNALADMGGIGGGGGLGGLGGGGLGGLGGGGLGGLGGKMAPRPTPLDPRQGLKAFAETERTGEFYRYTLAEKVSIPRRQAAMLPVLTRPLSGDAYSLYRNGEGGTEGKLLLSFRFKNDTGMQLSAGPLTVTDHSHYGGEAMLEDLLPHEETTLSYATDLATKVKKKVESDAKPNGPLTVRVANEGIRVSWQEQQRTVYRLTRSLPDPRRVILEHSLSDDSDWKLIGPKPWKQEESRYLFEAETVPGKEKVLEVLEEKPIYRVVKWPSRPEFPYHYSLDDLTELTLDLRAQPAQVQNVRISKGRVEETRRVPLYIRYILQHRGSEAREVTLVHSPEAQATLSEATPPTKTQDKEGWHFLHRLPANGKSDQTIREDRREIATWMLANADRTQLLRLRDDPATSPAVKAALQRTLDLQEQGQKLEAERDAVRDRLTEIETDQKRLRANLKELPPTSAAYKKHLDKFDKQEEEMEKLIAEEKKLRQNIALAQKEREAFLASVTAE